MVIEAATSDPRVRLLPSRLRFNIGSYLGVPVILADDHLYGTLCVLDPEPHHFTTQDLDLLIILSGWVRLYLERNSLTD